MKYLYIIHNNRNNKKYIGVSVDPERRWSRHISNSNKRCPALKSAINKYGKENFWMEVVLCGEDSYIDEMEVKFIEDLNTVSPNGYNLTLGGDGTVRVKWLDDWNVLLGTMPDSKLADKLGVTIDVVSSRRRGLNLKSFTENNRVNLDELLPLLGTDTDENIALQFGLSDSMIFEYRKRYNIKPFCIHLAKSPDYPVDQEHLLGVITDKELSEKFNITTYKIRKRREQLNIPKASLKNDYIPTEDELILIKDVSLSNKKVAGMLRKSSLTIQHIRESLGIEYKFKLKRSNKTNYRIDWDVIKPLILEGIPDKVIADKYSIPKKTIQAKRLEMGIKVIKKPSPSNTINVEAHLDLLKSKTPNKEVADIIGCSVSWVERKRKDLGCQLRGSNKENHVKKEK